MSNDWVIAIYKAGGEKQPFNLMRTMGPFPSRAAAAAAITSVPCRMRVMRDTACNSYNITVSQ